MARMSIDDKFLRDPRVTRLAERLGWNRYEARGRLLDVFAVCYDLETDIITPEDVNAAAGEARLAEVMLTVGLADLDDGGVRVHGAAKRIEYLTKKVEAGRKGGLKSAETRRKKGEAKRSSASPLLEAFGNPPDPVPDLPPDPVPVPEDQKLTLPRDPAVPAPPDQPVPPPVVTPAAHARADMRRRLFFRAWQLAGEAFSRVQANGIDATAPNGWSGTPNPGSPAARNLMAIVDGLLVGDRPDDQAAQAKIANGIAVSEARARALQPPTARFLIPACLWAPESWGMAVDMSPEQARAGPRGSAERATNTGRVEPPPRTDFRRGVQKI